MFITITLGHFKPILVLFKFCIHESKRLKFKYNKSLHNFSLSFLILIFSHLYSSFSSSTLNSLSHIHFFSFTHVFYQYFFHLFHLCTHLYIYFKLVLFLIDIRLLTLYKNCTKMFLKLLTLALVKLTKNDNVIIFVISPLTLTKSNFFNS